MQPRSNDIRRSGRIARKTEKPRPQTPKGQRSSSNPSSTTSTASSSSLHRAPSSNGTLPGPSNSPRMETMVSHGYEDFAGQIGQPEETPFPDFMDHLATEQQIMNGVSALQHESGGPENDLLQPSFSQNESDLGTHANNSHFGQDSETFGTLPFDAGIDEGFWEQLQKDFPEAVAPELLISAPLQHEAAQVPDQSFTDVQQQPMMQRNIPAGQMSSQTSSNGFTMEQAQDLSPGNSSSQQSNGSNNGSNNASTSVQHQQISLPNQSVGQFSPVSNQNAVEITYQRPSVYTNSPMEPQVPRLATESICSTPQRSPFAMKRVRPSSPVETRNDSANGSPPAKMTKIKHGKRKRPSLGASGNDVFGPPLQMGLMCSNPDLGNPIRGPPIGGLEPGQLNPDMQVPESVTMDPALQSGLLDLAQPALMGPPAGRPSTSYAAIPQQLMPMQGVQVSGFPGPSFQQPALMSQNGRAKVQPSRGDPVRYVPASVDPNRCNYPIPLIAPPNRAVADHVGEWPVASYPGTNTNIKAMPQPAVDGDGTTHHVAKCALLNTPAGCVSGGRAGCPLWHPSGYKASMCPKRPNCPNQGCLFAHQISELKVPVTLPPGTQPPST